MKHTEYVYTEKWYAWRPVKLECGRWAWFEWVEKTTDDRPLVYQGLLETYSYKSLKN